MNATDKYKTAAHHYARYRLNYPNKAYELIQKQCQLNGNGRLLDLGCGTGFLAITLAPYFQQVTGVDSSPNMLKEAKKIAHNEGYNNIEWIESRAEHLGNHLGQFYLITAGRSFHWMDAPTILPWIYNHLEEGGHLVLLGEKNGFWRAHTDWGKALIKLIEEFTSQDLLNYRKPFKPWEETLKTYPYKKVEAFNVPFEKTWTADEIIGFTFSTSFCSGQLLGTQAEAFKKEAKTLLLSMNPEDQFPEENDLSLVIAEK